MDAQTQTFILALLDRLQPVALAVIALMSALTVRQNMKRAEQNDTIISQNATIHEAINSQTIALATKNAADLAEVKAERDVAKAESKTNAS